MSTNDSDTLTLTLVKIQQHFQSFVLFSAVQKRWALRVWPDGADSFRTFGTLHCGCVNLLVSRTDYG